MSQWPEGPQLEIKLIPIDIIDAIGAAIQELVKEYFHPTAIPTGALASKGIEASVARRCEAMLSSEDFPKDAARGWQVALLDWGTA